MKERKLVQRGMTEAESEKGGDFQRSVWSVGGRCLTVFQSSDAHFPNVQQSFQF